MKRSPAAGRPRHTISQPRNVAPGASSTRVARAARAPAPSPSLRLGDCVFETERGELLRDGAPIRLTEAEAALLKALARAPNEAVDRLDLSGGGDGAGRAVDIQVTRLRRKIERDPKNPRYLQTVRGVGYMLAPDG